MHYWLIKVGARCLVYRPAKKSWGKKGATWDGVRNYQAANNLKKMQERRPIVFFTIRNIGKEIVGIIEIIKEAFHR